MQFSILIVYPFGIILTKIGWFPSSSLGTLILQAAAWAFFVKLELQKPHFQAGTWERAKIVSAGYKPNADDIAVIPAGIAGIQNTGR